MRKQYSLGSCRQYLLLLRSWKYSRIAGISSARSNLDWQYRSKPKTGMMWPPYCRFRCAIRESSSLSRRITSSTEQFFSVSQVSMRMSWSWSEVFWELEILSLSFLRYSARRMASSCALPPTISDMQSQLQQGPYYQYATSAHMTDSNQLQHEQQASNLMVSTDGRHTQNYFNSVLQNKTVTIQGIDRWLIRITMVVMVLFLVVYGCARVRVWQEARRTQNRQRVLDQYARVMMADYDERRDRAGGGRVDQGKWQYVDKEGYGVVLGKLRQLGCPQLSPAFPSSLSPYSSPSSSPSSPSSTPSPTTPVVAGISLSQLSASLQYMTLKSQPLFQPSALSLAQHAHYQQLYKIDSYTKQLPFCIVVPSFNNQASDRYKHNLNSIVQQQYRNYHVVVIEDRSTDDTGMLIDQYVRELRLQMAENGVDIEIDVHHNERNMKTMANLHKAAMDYCKEQEIFLVVDGDDELIGRQVLRLYNALFQRTGSWFIYSNFVTSTGSIGYSRPLRQQIIRDNNYRHSQFYTSHLRAYYTKLFRLIREQDLKADDGEYLHAANDVAICVPVLEMAHTRVTYVPELLYLYNSETGYNNHYLRLAEQNRNARLVKKRKKYEALVAMGFQG